MNCPVEEELAALKREPEASGEERSLQHAAGWASLAKPVPCKRDGISQGAHQQERP